METPKISSSHGAQAANSAKARPVSPDGAASPSSGFLALLAALGDAGPAAGDLSADGGAGQNPLLGDGQELRSCADLAALAAWQGLLPSDAPAVAQGANLTNGGVTGNALRTASLDGANGGALPQAGASMQGLSLPGGGLLGADGLPQGLVAETATLDGAAELKAGALPVAGAAQGRSWSRLQSAASQKAEGVAAGLAAPSRAGDPGSSALLAAVGAGTVALPAAGEAMASAHAAGAAAERAGGAVKGEAADTAGAQALDTLWSAVALARSGDAAGGGAYARPGEGRSEAGSWLDGAAGMGSLDAPGTDDATVFVDPSQAAREDQVAEQVSYWINQKTQNAELTLQRDGQAVEVSVSLTGNEAHVAFRSDESQTRELLDRSMAQLSELLRSEGLVLSGMSVGTSASHGENAGNADRQGQSRQGAPQAQVMAAAPTGSSPLLRGGAPNRAVDVFV